MEIELKYQPSATAAFCRLQAGEELTAESGSLMALKGPIGVTTTTHQKKGGGITAGLKRMFSGESFFLNHYQASGDGLVALCAPLPGDMMVHKLSGERLIVAGGSFVACSKDIHIDLEWQGLKGLFSGENLFWIKASGQGLILLNSFGFIYPIEVDGEYIVDTGHIVAFEETLTFSVGKSASGWVSSFFSGEGLVCRFMGRGTIWCQSHNPGSYGRSLTPYLRPKR